MQHDAFAFVPSLIHRLMKLHFIVDLARGGGGGGGVIK